MKEYTDRGWLPIPMVRGEKRPLIKWKHMVEWKPPFHYESWPWEGSGVAILLKPSNLLVIDCDSPEAVDEVIQHTERPCDNIIQTRSGAHFYFSRPERCPPLRTVQRGTSGKIDILADGYVVAPPSVHKSGFRYQWIKQGELQEAPDWAVGMLLTLRQKQEVTISSHTPESVWLEKTDLMWDLDAANTKCWGWNFGTIPLDVDRSRAIWLTMNTMLRLGYSEGSILKLLWFGSLNEKPRERGWDWLCGELARARLELRP